MDIVAPGYGARFPVGVDLSGSMNRGVVMRVVRGSLFKPLDIALVVGFAMAFVLLTSLRLA
jgi:hypothetical protein